MIDLLVPSSVLLPQDSVAKSDPGCDTVMVMMLTGGTMERGTILFSGVGDLQTKWTSHH